MNAPATKNRRTSRRSWRLVSFQLGVTLLTVVFSCLYYSHGGGKLGMIFPGLALCSFAALVCRAGWLIPCTALGTVLGLLVDSGSIKGGTAESQMWETVWRIVGLTIVGCIAGWIADFASREENV